jgi:hypothetical protein
LWLSSHSQVTLFGTSDPAEVVVRAAKVADVLKDILKKQGLTSRISGKEHVNVEGWQTLGTMVGVFPVPTGMKEVPWPDPCPPEVRVSGTRGWCSGTRPALRPGH